MARKEAFTPIWNYDDPEEKKDRKKMTIKELDRERGKRDADTKDEEEPKQYVGMFAEDRAAHHMTKKKERAIVVIVIVVAVIVSVLAGVVVARGRRELLRRYMKAETVRPQVICTGI